MCARVLPWSTPSTSNSNSNNANNNSALSFSLSASTTSSTASAAAAVAASASIPPLPSSPGSPSSPPVAFPASDSQANALSWPPACAPPPLSSAPASGSGAGGGQPSNSAPVSTSSSQGGGGGSAGTASASLPLPGANGVVVVGVIGRVEHELSQLLDRLLDAHVFGVKNRATDQWQESREQFVSNCDITGGTSRERKQRKEANRIGGGSNHAAQEDRVVEGGEGGSSVNNLGSEADELLGQKFGSRSGGKGHVKNGLYGKRKEEIEAGRGERKQVGSAEDSNAKRDVQFESRSGKGGNEDSGKARGDGWREGQWSLPWLLSKFKYHHDVEKGTVYVQFTWGVLPLDFLKEDSLKTSVTKDGLFATLENHEADGMRGLLFMFSVCHVILMVQEGASFDPHLLRIFRLLQTAKHSLAPFVKTQILPGLLPPPSSTARASPLKPISLGTRQAYGRSGVAGQNSSTVALMSGSTPVLIPGQCTPVALFVYLEDMPDSTLSLSPHSMTRAEEVAEMSSSSVYQTASMLPLSNNNHIPRQNPVGRPSGTGLALLRTGKKSEAGLRKKLQGALEAQIRFLLKKCRTVAGFGDTTPIGSGVGPGMGPRGPGSNANSFQGVGGGGALFVLDPSRAVILLDRMANSQTDALDAATDAIEAMFSGRDNVEDILWDLGSNAVSSGDDLQSVKDFLWRQAEILRGKGPISGNSGGGTGGVGMVAAAAAAAAASAASGLAGGTNKPICNPPELPTFSSWLSACRILAEALSARLAEDSERAAATQKFSDVTHSGTRKGAVSPTKISGSMGKVVKTKPTMESSLVCLDTGSHLDHKFSAAWCERVLPSALDVYLKGLPPSYPTALHKSHLEKALRVFHSMVRGHAVPLYAEKLKKQCESVWHSGRQLCDAQSLTGKPCIHQVHDVSTHMSNDGVKDRSTASGKGMSEKLISKPHSSGVVFLHACACGRSRKLRKDPFDFESANVTFFRFPNCEELLPSLVIPSPSENLSSGGSPWSLVRLGMSRYYQPEVGLVQSGFFPNQNFLSFWDIPLVYSTNEGQIDPVVVSPSKEEVAEVVSSKPHSDPKVTNKSLLRGTKSGLQTKPAGANLHGRASEKGYVDNKTRGASGNLAARRGFTDSTSKVNYGGEAAFPPLPEKQDKLLVATAKPVRQQGGKDRKNRSVIVRDDENSAPPAVSLNDVIKDSRTKVGASFDGDDELVPSVRDLCRMSSELNVNAVTQHVRVYIGFEHECPHGHRFLLSDNQPERLTSSSSSLKTGTGLSSKHKKHDRIESQMKDPSSLTGSQQSDATMQQTSGNAAGPQIFPPKWTQKGAKIPEKMHYWSVQDGHGDGHSLLNSNLPIYMHCPFCKPSGEDSKSNKKFTFGGTISQLQRVFLVTPSLPVRLASCPVVEFEDISNPAKTVLKFNPGSEILLPPDSFLSLRLPFVYYSQVGGDPHMPLLVNQSQPERCAWLVKNTALYVLSKGGIIEPTTSGSSG
ncbi:unnamed protein product [Calypogeia fissa]